MNALAQDLIGEVDRADIQGIVTSGFGHLPEMAYVFIRFSEATPARRWLRDVQPDITSARSWRTDPSCPKQPPGRTFNLAFTAAGLQAIGLSSRCLQSFPAEFVEGITGRSRLE